MKRILSLGKIVTKSQQRKISGGDVPVAECSVECGDGNTCTCDGSDCVAVPANESQTERAYCYANQGSQFCECI